MAIPGICLTVIRLSAKYAALAGPVARLPVQERNATDISAGKSNLTLMYA
jgi:hypothetical protein